MLTEGIYASKDPDASNLAKTHALREIQVTTKLAQQGNNDTPLSVPMTGGNTWNNIPDAGHHGRAGALLFILPSQWILPRQTNGKSRFQDLNNLQEGLYLQFVNGSFMQFNKLLGTDATLSGSTIPLQANDWRRCDPNLVGSNGELEPVFTQGFCLGSTPSPVFNPSNSYALQGGGMNTVYTLARYSEWLGKNNLKVDAQELGKFTKWMDAAWPSRQ